MIINIIGRGEGYEQGYEAEGEKWGINYFHPSLDILFNIHPVDHDYYVKNKREIDNAEAAGVRIITQIDYPIVEIIQKYSDYLGSSTDWIIAYSLFADRFRQVLQEIHLWGVTMDDKGDHYEKRCATDFWCGVAIGRGVKVVVHGNSRVMTTEDGLTYGLFTPMSRKYIEESNKY